VRPAEASRCRAGTSSTSALIVDARARRDGLHVTYATSPAARLDHATLEMTSRSARARVFVRLPATAPRALDYHCARIVLPAPLGRRTIVDGATGRDYRKTSLAQVFDRRARDPSAGACVTAATRPRD
jgi:hypothetical protein